MNYKIIHLFSIAILILVSSILLNGQSINSSNQKDLGTKRNANYNIEEIKVRWKKAALENCPGVPCVVPPSPPTSFTCGTSTISDIDGNNYNVVTIGTQCWTKENLKVTKYNDGTTIPDETTNIAGWGTLGYAARTEYTGVTGYVSAYGYLYNWHAVAGIITAGGAPDPTKNLCPVGWHVSTDTDWTNLSNFLGTNVGGKLKSTATGTGTTEWLSPNTNANDQYGFSALPAGWRDTDGSFTDIGSFVSFWSATSANVGNSRAWTRNLRRLNGNMGRADIVIHVGNPVRCIKD